MHLEFSAEKGVLKSIRLNNEGTEHPTVLGLIEKIIYIIKILCKVPTCFNWLRK
jgi:hypothetical protein